MRRPGLGTSALLNVWRGSQGALLRLVGTLGAAMACVDAASLADREARRFLVSEPEYIAKIHDRYGAWYGDRPPEKLAMRIGGGGLGYLQRDPSATYIVFLRHPTHAAGGQYRTDIPLTVAKSSDIVRMTERGDAWHLIGETGRIVNINVGGIRNAVTNLPSRSAFTGCAQPDSTVFFLDSKVPGRVFSYSSSGTLAHRDLPAMFHSVPWSRTRFGGSAYGPCVLFNPLVDAVLIVGRDSIREVGRLVESVPRFPWYTRWWSALLRQRLPSGVLDATSFNGGVAVLFEGTSQQAGRVVDFYGTSGYVASWILPERPLGIAGSLSRVYSMAARRDSAMLYSFIVPPPLRHAMVDSEPAVFVPRRSPDAVILNDTTPR